MSTLIVSVEDASMLSRIKSAIEQLRGVTDVYEGDSYDPLNCAAYKEAMDDVKNGRVYSSSSVDDMFHQILG